MDGATDFQCFWKIKWPAIMPTTLYILVITTINSFQCFALIQLLTSGGPNHSTDTIMYYIYYTAFKLYRYGYGNAMGVVLAIIIAILSAIQFKVATRIIEEVRNNECNCCNRKKAKALEASPQQAQAGQRLYHPDPDPDQHRGRDLCVPAVLDHHRFLQNRCSINSTTPEWWPHEWVLTNYQKLFAGKSAPLWQLAIPFSARFSADGDPIYFSVGPTAPAALRWMINTVFMAVVSMILTCITAAMAGYALAKKRFVGRQLLFTLIVCAMALPKQVILIPLLREMSA